MSEKISLDSSDFNHKIHYLKHKLHLIPYFNLFIHFFLGQ